MPIDASYDVETDGNRVFLSVQAFGYSDVFGANIFYPGQLFQIQEIAKIALDVTDEKGIDVDLRYYTPNRYFGSWQVFRDTGLIVAGRRVFSATGTNEPEYQGRITDYEVTLSRITYHSIGDATSQARSFQGFQISGCNSAAGEFSLEFGGVQTSVQDYVDKENVFTGRIFGTPPPLADREFFSKLRGIGLYLAQGVEVQSATYEAAVINTLDHGGAIRQPAECQIRTPQVDCAALVQAYVADKPELYLDPAVCEIESNGIPCVAVELRLDSFCGVSYVFRKYESIPDLPGGGL